MATLIRTILLLGLACAWLPAGAAGPAASAAIPDFVPGSAFAAAVKQQATGIYVLGTTRIRTWSAVHYVLVRDGRGLQIQTKAGGAWLPKLDGSGGGHTVGLERFEQLLSLAGGVNRDVKQLPSAHRDRFLCLAGFGGCVARSDEAQVSPSLAARRSAPGPLAMLPSDVAALPVSRVLAKPAAGPFMAALLTVAPLPAGGRTQPYFAHGAPGQEFRFAFDAAARRLWFDGWGIHASWLVPPLDEI